MTLSLLAPRRRQAPPAPPRAQLQLLGLHAEIIVDLFAGGGGASTGIEVALGRQVDAAVNHDPAAVALHEANHPQTEHYRRDVFEVEPVAVTQGRPVGLLWASPDCTFHSKARGGKPIRSGVRKRRALAWVVTRWARWAGQVRPRVIMLENVEEFANWGPLVGPPDALRPCPKRKGKTFRRWVRSLRELGYDVEWRELRACDFGAPTIRRRLFLIARCDGAPIVWPEATHGPGLRPYRTAAECIDWSLPCPSIFERKRPLAENTLRRIARGVRRYVLDTPRPFIVANNTNNVARPVDEPAATVTTGNRLHLVAPTLAQIGYGERAGQAPRALNIEEPLTTVVGSQKHALVAAFLAQNNDGPHNGSNAGRAADVPISTVTASGSQQSVVAAHIQRDFGQSTGAPADAPLGTITSGGMGKAALVYSFLASYYGQGDGQALGDPLRTVTTKDRFGLVTVEVGGAPFVMTDIGMRMLQPRELYNAQGFPPGYVIDRGPNGKPLTKTEQVRMVGNSVSPPMAAALALANVPDMVARHTAERLAA
ncbi:MAG TPA: DNA cytosine methyltransferase [Rubricoccaceae bacterium]|jgi:DNA (cytosine-5)-methyltransferase 1